MQSTRRPSRPWRRLRPPASSSPGRDKVQAMGHRTGVSATWGRLRTSHEAPEVPPHARTTARASTLRSRRSAAASALRALRMRAFSSRPGLWESGRRAWSTVNSWRPVGPVACRFGSAHAMTATPSRRQVLRSASRTESARRLMGYRRPSSSSAVEMPVLSRNAATSRSGVLPKISRTASGWRYRRASRRLFETLQRPLPVARMERPVSTSRSRMHVRAPVRAAVMAAASPLAPPPMTRTS